MITTNKTMTKIEENDLKILILQTDIKDLEIKILEKRLEINSLQLLNLNLIA